MVPASPSPQSAPTPHPYRHVVLTRFRACQRERPRLQAAATGPCWRCGCVSQRTSASTRTALAAAALAEPLGEALPDGRASLLGDLQQEGPQRLAEDLQEKSREQPSQGSSPHAGAETDQRHRLQRRNRGNEKAPRLCETLRVGAPVWAHSDIYMPKSDDKSSHRQVAGQRRRPASGCSHIRSIRSPNRVLLMTVAVRLRARRPHRPCPPWAALGPQPGRERPERLGQPRAAVGSICPAQHTSLAEDRRSRSAADSL
jgi:hypothetical protein